jgi:hypothetical protein
VYVRTKTIKGHVYYYLVRGERQGGKVKQKVVRYLGKHPGVIGGAGATLSAPTASGAPLGTTSNAGTLSPAAPPLQAAPPAVLGPTPSVGLTPEPPSTFSRTRDHTSKKPQAHTVHPAPAPPATLLQSDAWQRWSDNVPMRLDVVKVKGGISWQMYENDHLWMATFSERPYRLGQACDGTIDQCVHALFILWCRATGRDPQALYHKAYGDKPTTTPETYNLDEQEEKLRLARGEGIEVPATWGPKAFQGLLDSLAEINHHALVDILRDEPEPDIVRQKTPALSTAVFNRERGRALAEQALTDLSDALAAGKGDALTTYLDAMARFRTYSLSNQLRIAAQCPDATLVAGFRDWKKRGRYVRKGEKGILITAPVLRKSDSDDLDPATAPVETEDPGTVVGYRPVYVFDVSQTEGEPLPSLSLHEARGDPGVHTEKLKAFVSAQGITLEYTTALRSGVLGSSSGGRIRLREGLSPVEEFTTLAHEVAHELLHHTPAERAAKTVRETEAEAVAHVVSTAIGLTTTEATADYIRLYQGDTETLRASLETIRQTANTILQGVGL